MSNVLQGRAAGSTVRPGSPWPRTTGRNQAVYDSAVASIDGRADIAAFVARVEAMGPGCRAYVCVNPSTLGWTPGAPANFSLYVSLVHTDGTNILSYNGGGDTVETAIARADADLRRYIQEWVVAPYFRYA